MSISKRLMLIITCSSLAMGLIILIVSYQLMSELLRSMYVQRIKEVAKNFAASASVGVVFGDKLLLEKLSSSLMKNEGIKGVVLADAKGRTLFKSGTEAHNYLEIAIEASHGEGILFVPAQEKGILGTVRVYYTMEVLEKKLSKLLINIALIVFLTTILTNILAYILVSKAVLVPLRKLVDAVRNVSAGCMDVKVEGGDLPETAELAEAFNTMIDSIKEHQSKLRKTYEEMAKNQFLAEIGKFSLMIAHEIKNPLSVIKGAIDILKKDSINSETKNQMLSFIEEDVARIDRLVKDFLQLSRPNNLNIVKANLKDLLSSTAEKFSVMYGKTIQVEADDALFETDVALVERILSNLIDNAFEAGAMTVKLTGRKSNGIIEILVSDNGCGIPKDSVEDIFKPFFTTKDKGTGLGLSVVLQAVYALGGSVEVFSKEREGTTFKIVFPEKGVDHGKDFNSGR